MEKRLALLSTGIGVVETIAALVRAGDPQIEIINIVDDSIVKTISRNQNIVPPHIARRIAQYCRFAEESGAAAFLVYCSSIVKTISRNQNIVPPHIARRIAQYCRFAEESGAAALLVTCSSISETIDSARPMVSIPVFKIDEPMAEHAVATANSTIGVVATLQTTLQPTTRLIQSKIRASGKVIALRPVLAEGAFDALQKGRPNVHDEIVLAGIRSLLESCDIVVLAQASMARAAAVLSPDDAVRVLTSPRLGVARAISHFAGRA